MHPNVEIAQSAYAAFGQGDMETLKSTIAPDCVWHSGGDNALTGTYTGHGEILGFMAQIGQMTGGSFSLDIHDMLGNDDHVVVLASASGTRDGKSLDARVVHIMHVTDGLMTEFWAFPEDGKAFDEFWG
jgi:ketosteroid isomerase-like protein